MSAGETPEMRPAYTLAQYSFFNLSAETVITQAAKEAYSSQHIPETVTDQITNGIVLHQQRYVELFTAPLRTTIPRTQVMTRPTEMADHLPVLR